MASENPNLNKKRCETSLGKKSKPKVSLFETQSKTKTSKKKQRFNTISKASTQAAFSNVGVLLFFKSKLNTLVII